MSRRFEIALGNQRSVLSLDAEIDEIIEINTTVIVRQKEYMKTIYWPNSINKKEKVDSMKFSVMMSAITDINDNKVMTFKEIVDDI